MKTLSPFPIFLLPLLLFLLSSLPSAPSAAETPAPAQTAAPADGAALQDEAASRERVATLLADLDREEADLTSRLMRQIDDRLALQLEGAIAATLSRRTSLAATRTTRSAGQRPAPVASRAGAAGQVAGDSPVDTRCHAAPSGMFECVVLASTGGAP